MSTIKVYNTPKTIAIIILTFALLTACATAPAPAEALPVGIGGGDLVALRVGIGATVIASNGAIVQAATAEAVLISLTIESQSTAQALTIRQTEAAINSAATAQMLSDIQAVANVTATAGAANIIATGEAQQAAIASTQQAIQSGATAQAMQSAAEREALESQLAIASIQAEAEQSANSKAMIGALTTLGAGALIVIALVALLFFANNLLVAHRQNANIREFSGGAIVQHDGTQWLPVISTRALPAPAYNTLEPLDNADIGTGDSADFIDGVIKVNNGDGESYYMPRLTEAEQQARVKVLALLVAAMRFHGVNGGNQATIPGWRQMREAGLKPRNPSPWQAGAGPLRQAGIIESKAGIGTRIVASEYPDLQTLYRAVNVGTLTLRPINHNLESEIIENTTGNNW